MASSPVALQALASTPDKHETGTCTPDEHETRTQNAANQEVTTHGPAPVTPTEYARAVDRCSRLSTGAGQNFEKLAAFLLPHPVLERIPREAEAQEGFVTVYKLSTTKDDNGGGEYVYRTTPTHVHSYDEFERSETPTLHGPQKRLFFLKGWPTPQWLNLIGCRYRIDPEFFSRHLDFPSPYTEAHNYSRPPLPSSSTTCFRLNLTTLGVKPNRRRVSHGEVRKLRRENSDKMAAYHSRLMKGQGFKTGDAIVREYVTLDATNFALEQYASVYLKQLGSSWSIFIWLDGGNLDNCPDGPWPTNSGCPHPEEFFVPVLVHTPMLGLRSRRLDPTPESSSMLQGVSRISLDYGQSLDPIHNSIMAQDSFHALNHLCTFAASAEHQFLNLMEQKLDKYEYTEDEAESAHALPDLKYLKRTLNRHIKHNQEALQLILRTKVSEWPKSYSSSGTPAAWAVKAQVAVRDLTMDFETLLKRSQDLQARCTEDINILMNAIVIEESNKAMKQAERIGKLTFLAFVFVPLSFTTSFFGMNFKELGVGQQTNPISIWVWFVLAVPLLAVAVAFYVWDVSQLWRACKRGIAAGLDGLRHTRW